MYFCYGKKGVCDADITNCATCSYFDNSGGYELEEGRRVPTPDIQHIFEYKDQYLIVSVLRQMIYRCFSIR